MWVASLLLSVASVLVPAASAQIDPGDNDGPSPVLHADEVQLRTGDVSQRFEANPNLTTNGYDEPFMERLRKQLPDPEDAIAEARARIENLEDNNRMEREVLQLMIERISAVQYGRQVRLTLEDVLRRALAHSLAIRVSSYDPAIETTRVVEAEAAFDAAFFTNITNNKQNRPATNALSGTDIEAFNAQSGIRKLLPTGMQVETSYVTSRQSNDFAFQTINPVWFSQFVTQFRQPLLRGFGLDYNRSQIRINKLTRRRVTQTFRRQVHETLRQTEEAYWRLVQARRNLVISARLLASFEQIYNYLDARRDFDVYRIQLADTKARLERTRAQFIELIALVRDAEDQLIALMNDPEINLTDEIEIVPVIAPHFARIELDRVGEVQAALDNRPEIVEARLSIDAARIQVGVAKNQAMPQLDLVFRYSVDGLGRSSDRAFSEVTKNDFHEYYVGVDFELPIGNRARRAALRRAKIQYAQSMAALKQVFEQVIFDVNQAVRRVETRYDQIDPALQSVEATEDQVASIQARAEKKDFLTLNTELNTEQSLAQARRDLLSALVDYGVAIIDLERAKGTLLQYNRVELTVDDLEANDPVN